MTRIPRKAISTLAVGVLLTLPVNAQSAISTDGAIESKSGGFKFPDGTVQTTAVEVADPCPTMDPSDEMILVGGVCIDKYEASIWDAPTGGNQIHAFVSSDYCNPNGQDCTDIYARSVAGVLPARAITWFQAQQALANSGKRLPTNAEWQMAVAGTPDNNIDCNVDTSGRSNTGAFDNCVSNWGTFDMVGNMFEFVADWVPYPTDCPDWGDFSDDQMCLAGASTTEEGPGVLLRGGSFVSFSSAGPFAVSGFWRPSSSVSNVGFRGARESPRL